MLVLNDFHNNFDIWSMRLAAGQKPVPFVVGSYSAGLARPTADGRQVAYTSAESGENEVYVRPYPGPGGRVQVSSGGGTEPVWSRDGRRLFYKAGRRMMVATLSPPPNVRVLSRDSLFAAQPLRNLSGAMYDVAADGRVLTLRADDRNVQLVIALGWAAQALAEGARR